MLLGRYLIVFILSPEFCLLVFEFVSSQDFVYRLLGRHYFFSILNSDS